MVLRYGLGVGILIYFFEENDFHWGLLKDLLVPQMFVVLLLLKFAVYVLVSLRWRRILKELSVEATVGQSISFSFLAIFFTYFLPGNMSSDVAKSFFAARVLGNPGRVVFAIIIDRIVGLVSLLMLLFIGLSVFYASGSTQVQRVLDLITHVPWLYLIAGGVIVIGLTIGLWYFIKTHRKFIELKDILTGLRSWSFWGQVFLLSLVSHFIFAVFLAVAASAIHLTHIDLLGCMIIFPLSTLAMIIPLTPGSLGVGQVLYQYLFDAYAGTETQASLLFTVLQVADLLFMVYGAWYFSRLLKLKK